METELSAPETKLGGAVYEARVAAGLTQEKLAQQAELSVRTVRSIERGEIDPREGTVNKICEALEIPPIVLRCMATSDDEIGYDQDMRKHISNLIKVYHENRDG